MFRVALAEIFSAAQFNPVLWLALKHEGESSDRLMRFGQRLRFGAYGLAFLFTLPTLLNLPASLINGLGVWFVALIFSYAVSFGMDVIYILAARFGSDVRGEFWEALRLTLLPSAALVEGKYLNGQRRVWRWLVVETAFRHFLSAALLFMLILPMILLSPFWALAAGWLLIIPTAWLLFSYIYEPLWRMRAVLALGFAAVVRLRDDTMALLAAIGIAFGVRLLQIIFIVTLPLQSRLIGTVSSSGNALLGLLPWLNLFAIYFLFYRIYRHLQFRAIRIAQRYAETEP
jgi:hypothetical protein